MKKLLFAIPLLLILLAVGNKNPKHDYVITFDLNDISVADTVLFVDDAGNPLIMNGSSVGVEVDYTYADTTDATMTVGTSNFGYTFNSVSTTSFPYTLDAQGDTATVNGYIPKYADSTALRATKSWIISTHPNSYLPIKLTKGSVNVAAEIKIKINQIWD